MESRVEQAVARHKQGYNCAQAVACTYCDLFGLDEGMAYRIAEGFGKGMGGMRDGTCGPLSSACMLVGLSNSVWGPEKGKTKQTTYNFIRVLCTAFKDQNGSILCCDLLGLGAPGIKRACDGCIGDASRLLEAYLEEHSEQSNE